MIAAFSIVSRDVHKRVRIVMPVQAVRLDCLPRDWNNGVQKYHDRGRAK